MAIIETHELTKRYGSARGIEGVSMAVEPGEVFGFLGPNGAGKTTTIRTLLDLLHPTSGSATIFGLDSRRDSLAIRARLGNLPGDFAYDPRLTGRELVTFLAELRGMPDLGRAPELAARFHADMDKPLGELSRGNRQKIGARPSRLPRSGAARPRRAHQRARPAHAGGVPRLRRRGARARPARSSSPRTSSTRSSGRATASPSSATAGSSPSRASPTSSAARTVT